MKCAPGTSQISKTPPNRDPRGGLEMPNFVEKRKCLSSTFIKGPQTSRRTIKLGPSGLSKSRMDGERALGFSETVDSRQCSTSTNETFGCSLESLTSTNTVFWKPPKLRPARMKPALWSSRGPKSRPLTTQRNSERQETRRPRVAAGISRARCRAARAALSFKETDRVSIVLSLSLSLSREIRVLFFSSFSYIRTVPPLSSSRVEVERVQVFEIWKFRERARTRAQVDNGGHAGVVLALTDAATAQGASGSSAENPRARNGRGRERAARVKIYHTQKKTQRGFFGFSKRVAAHVKSLHSISSLSLVVSSWPCRTAARATHTPASTASTTSSGTALPPLEWRARADLSKSRQRAFSSPCTSSSATQPERPSESYLECTLFFVYRHSTRKGASRPRVCRPRGRAVIGAQVAR